jgi:hypothetical protein
VPGEFILIHGIYGKAGLTFKMESATIQREHGGFVHFYILKGLKCF